MPGSTSSSSSSSSSGTPSPSSSPVLLGSFDPFAEHPFTRYSGPSKPTLAPTQSHGAHILPHPSEFHLDGPAPSIHPAPGYSTQGIQTGYYGQQHGSGGYHSGSSTPSSHPSMYPQSGMPPSSQFKPIHVPFRQDTSSPDLSQILRRKQMGA